MDETALRGAGAHISKDIDLWLDDGNIVIVAQNTAFRVHKSLLMRHSEVFCNLLTIPQPTNPGDAEMIEGYPVVRVTDTSSDFRELLRVLYGGVR